MSILNHAPLQPTSSALSQTAADTLAGRFLHAVLFITVFSGGFIVVEPAPYEFLAAVLGFACLLARVPFNRLVLPLFVLLFIRDAGGVIGLLPVLSSGFQRTAGDPTPILSPFEPDDSTRFLAISFYLGLTAILYACIFAQNPTRAIPTLRTAYISCAVLAALLGTLGYFATFYDFMPAMKIFAMNQRAVGVFKDPNIFGCFLVPPLIWEMERFIVDRVRLTNLIGSIIILLGILLSGSRAAWGSVAFCVVTLIYLLFLTRPDRRTRMRIVAFAIGGIALAILLLAVLSSIDVVGQMLTSRLGVQDYDVGMDNRSRFQLHEDSLREILSHPLGMGPWGFAHTTNWVSHETYLGTLLNHGWIGGVAYITLTVLTLYVGFKSIWISTPWRSFLIATYISYVALMLEAFIVDTDHWRHFYLLLGIVWGLAAATITYSRTTAPRARN